MSSENNIDQEKTVFNRHSMTNRTADMIGVTIILTAISLVVSAVVFQIGELLNYIFVILLSEAAIISISKRERVTTDVVKRTVTIKPKWFFIWECPEKNYTFDQIEKIREIPSDTVSMGYTVRFQDGYQTNGIPVGVCNDYLDAKRFIDEYEAEKLKLLFSFKSKVFFLLVVILFILLVIFGERS